MQVLAEPHYSVPTSPKIRQRRSSLHVLYVYERPALELVCERVRPLSSVEDPSFGRSQVLICPVKQSLVSTVPNLIHNSDPYQFV